MIGVRLSAPAPIKIVYLVSQAPVAQWIEQETSKLLAVGSIPTRGTILFQERRLMSGLEQSFYIIGIVFMAVMLILIASIVTALVVIRNKIVSLEKTVADKLLSAAKPINKVVEIANAVREVAKAAR